MAHLSAPALGTAQKHRCDIKLEDDLRSALPFLLNILRIFQELTTLVARRESKGYLHDFCWHLAAETFLAQAKFSSINPKRCSDAESILIYEALDKFESLFSKSSPETSSLNLARCTGYNQLKNLEALCTQPGDRLSKIEMVGRYLDFEDQSVRDLESFLLRCCNNLPANAPTEQEEFYAPQRRWKEPVFDACDAASFLFDTLVASAACVCHGEAQYAARIGLSTHRSADHSEDEFNFDVFLNGSNLLLPWQEAHIKTILQRQTKVRIILPEADSRSTLRKSQRHVLVERFCTLLRKRGSPIRLNLIADNGKLWRAKGFNTTERVEPPLTLEQVIRTHPFTLTEKTKRILAILLGHGIIHLFSSDWLQSTFTSSNIVFLGTSSGTPLRPYIQAQLSKIPRVEASDFDQDENDEFDIDDCLHPYPVLVAFACVLMELFLGRTIEALAKDSGHDIVDIETENKRYAVASDVYENFKAQFGLKYGIAVYNCLDMGIYTGDNDELLEGDELRRVIYEKVVLEIEDELDQGFNNSVSVDELDDAVSKLTFGNYGLPVLEADVDSKSAVRSDSPSLETCSSIRIPMANSPASGDRGAFKVAIICALPLEADAVRAVFDKNLASGSYGKAPGDQNAYSLGLIGGQHVVLVHMPEMGVGPAATAAASCRSSFPNIELALVVGICGAVPFPKENEEIVLGDVVISDGIINFTYGKQLPDQFMRKDQALENLPRPNSQIRALLTKLKGSWYRETLRDKASQHLSALQQELAKLGKEVFYPGVTEDRLFEPTYRHKHQPPSQCPICVRCKQKSDPICEPALLLSCQKTKCENNKLIARKRLEESRAKGDHRPLLHFGMLASGSTVMKSGEDRDAIASREKVIAFEMEGAGVWDTLPSLIIKGVCDYADSHKNKVWQDYAAATAAAYMKAFLEVWHAER